MLNLTESSIINSLQRAVRKLDATAKRHKSYPFGFVVLGEVIPVEVKQDRADSYNRTPIGRWRLAIGSYRDTTRFAAQKNDFDYDKMAANMVERAKAAKISRTNSERLKRQAAAFSATVEYKMLDALGIELYEGTAEHSSVDILKKLSPAAFAELKKACGVK